MINFLFKMRRLLHHAGNFSRSKWKWREPQWSELAPDKIDFEKLDFTKLQESRVSPSAVQGFWQARGAVRAAQISGSCTIIATGILGIGLYLYKEKLSIEKKALEQSKKDMQNEREYSKKEESLIWAAIGARYESEKMLEFAESKIAADPEHFQQYKQEKQGKELVIKRDVAVKLQEEQLKAAAEQKKQFDKLVLKM